MSEGRVGSESTSKRVIFVWDESGRGWMQESAGEGMRSRSVEPRQVYIQRRTSKGEAIQNDTMARRLMH